MALIYVYFPELLGVYRRRRQYHLCIDDENLGGLPTRKPIDPTLFIYIYISYMYTIYCIFARLASRGDPQIPIHPDEHALLLLYSYIPWQPREKLVYKKILFFNGKSSLFGGTAAQRRARCFHPLFNQVIN